MTVRDIHQKTKKYIEKNKEFEEFLRNENINFTLEDSIHYNRELDKKY
ncbi:putative lipo domain protein [Rickettsia bellii str. RML Mogi]|uniref:Putative lipo domain protein n=2 Tax=Bacteria TaxID=2 RepID=A0A0F3QFZ4_RICBE|nr:putative lipo domain protein [Rickettsia bellii str. RML Mogi]